MYYTCIYICLYPYQCYKVYLIFLNCLMKHPEEAEFRCIVGEVTHKLCQLSPTMHLDSGAEQAHGGYRLALALANCILRFDNQANGCFNILPWSWGLGQALLAQW